MKTPLTTLAALTAVSVLALAACSSDSTTPSTAPQDPGAVGSGDTSAASAPDKNPDGVPYPTANLGTSPRSGSTPGNVMQNYKFLGYKDGKISNGLTPMSLADFFDPQAKNYKMIRIQASGSWCVHCEKETETVAALSADLASRKVAWIISLAEGPTPGVPSTTTDLTAWINKYQAPYTHFLDPGNHNDGDHRLRSRRSRGREDPPRKRRSVPRRAELVSVP